MFSKFSLSEPITILNQFHANITSLYDCSLLTCLCKTGKGRCGGHRNMEGQEEKTTGGKENGEKGINRREKIG